MGGMGLFCGRGAETPEADIVDGKASVGLKGESWDLYPAALHFSFLDLCHFCNQGKGSTEKGTWSFFLKEVPNVNRDETGRGCDSRSWTWRRPEHTA